MSVVFWQDSRKSSKYCIYLFLIGTGKHWQEKLPCHYHQAWVYCILEDTKFVQGVLSQNSKHIFQSWYHQVPKVWHLPRKITSYQRKSWINRQYINHSTRTISQKHQNHARKAFQGPQIRYLIFYKIQMLKDAR